MTVVPTRHRLSRSRALRRTLAAIGAVAVALAGSTPAAFAAGTGTIEGTVTTPAGVSPDVVSVSVISESGTFSQMASVAVDGSYRVTDLPTGGWILYFHGGAADLVSEYYDGAYTRTDATPVVVAADASATADVTLERGGVVEGTVRDDAGRPVADALVSASRSDWSEGGAYDVTDAQGHYHLGGLRTGGYRIGASPALGTPSPYVQGWVGGGTSWSTASVIQVQAGATLTGQDATMPTAARATGRLMSAGVPVASGSVRFTSTTDGSNVVWVTTGIDGTFEGRMSPGTYRVQFTPPEGSTLAPQYWRQVSSESAATPVTVSSGSVFAFGDVVLATGATLSGRVTGPGGEPAAGVSVSVSVTGGGLAAPRTAVTGDDGTYAVTGLSAGTYQVSFTPTAASLLVPEYFDDASGLWEAEPVVVAAGATVTGIDAVLARGGGADGRVLDADGAPVAGASVLATPVEYSTGAISRMATTGADGRFRVAGLAAGDWYLEITPPFGTGWAREYYLDAGTRSAATVVRVAVGEARELQDVRLEKGATLHGTVLDPDGLPLAGASVSASGQDGSTGAFGQTAADGTFTIVGLRAGSYRVSMSPPSTRTDLVQGYHPNGASWEAAELVAVTSGGSTTLPATRLARAASLRGTVTKPDGSPVVGASVSASGSTWGGSAVTGADGSYSVDRLPAGQYQVSVWADSEFAGTYDGITTYYDGARGSQRPSLASPVALTAGTTRPGVDVVVPPRGDVAPDVSVTLDPSAPRIGRPVTARVTVGGTGGPAAGGVVTLGLEGRTTQLQTDVVLDAAGKASYTFDAFEPFDTGAVLYGWFSGTALYDEAGGEAVYAPVAPVDPVVTSISPSAGSTRGGAVVTVTGNGFTSDATVTFGGVPAPHVVVDSSTTLRATTPVLPAGAAPVVVTTPDGVSGDDVVFTATAETTVTTVSTSAAEVVEGSAVTFTAVVSSAAGTPSGSVAFAIDGGTPTTVPLSGGSATLTRDDLAPGAHTVTATYGGDVVHAGSAGSGGVVVTPAGPVVTGVTPGVLTTEGGKVVVTGRHLSGATEVRFGGVAGTGVTVVSATRIEVTAPARDAGTVPVVVTTPAGTSAPTVVVQFVDAGEGVVSQTPVRAESRPVVAPGAPVCLQVAGTNGVPAGASGVTLNVTTVRPNGPGYVVVYPDTAGDGSTPVPAGSSANFEAGADVANAAFVELPASGRVCYVTRGAPSVGIILDVTGFSMPEAGVVTQSPTRLLDTRPVPYHVGDVTGPVLPGAVRTVQVRGRAGVPANATAVIVNATVTNVTGAGNLRVFPAGTSVPNASVLNYAPGKDKANAAIVALSSSGQLAFYSDGSAVDVILDVTGYVTDGAAYAGTSPTRVLDTRPGAGQLGSITGPLRGLQPSTFTIPGALVPEGATSVVLNVTAIRPETLGNLRVYPADSAAVPNASTINYIPGRDIPNLVVVDLPDSGPARVALYSDSGGTVNVAVDVAGFVVPAG